MDAMPRRLTTLLALLLLSCVSSQLLADDFSPTAENFDAWQRHILPSAEETTFESIPWISSFGAGLLEANKQDKPLLFWAMNGHPLGCT